MNDKNPAILKAERLRAVMNMPEYEITLGAWIQEAHNEALHNMTTAIEPYQFHSAQGAYKAISSLKENIEYVLRAEKVALEAIQKNLQRKLNSV